MCNDVDIVDRMRAASLRHEDLQYGWLAEAIDEIVKLRAAAKEGARYKTAVEKLERILMGILFAGVAVEPGFAKGCSKGCKGAMRTLLAAIEAAKEASDG